MSCSNSQWEQKLEECKSRDRVRCYRDDDRSRGSSRWEQKMAEHKVRDRNRCYRDDDRNSTSNEDNSKKALIGATHSEIIKSGKPNCTIMIRGLAHHITEADIRQEIILYGLLPKDIRLIRTKDKEASRGFAFIEFFTVDDASRWMDIKNGVLVLQDQYHAVMQYSIPKVIHQELASNKAALDWFCIKCGAQNFRRRGNCFKCYSSRTESENGGSGSDEVCNYVTKTVMLRNLDALTTEDSVIQILNTVMPEVAKKISGVRIGRDPLTSTSRGVCYLGTDSIVDALVVYGALTSSTPPLSIDGKTVIASYGKYNIDNTEKTYNQAVQAFPDASQPTTYTLDDVNKLAQYSASRYAKTDAEYQQYFEYYTNYFAKQINTENLINPIGNQTDAANAAAAVAQSAIQQKCAAKVLNATHLAVPNGIDGKQYPIPDTTRYTYENVSGYYYDRSTGLYYDPNSNYYWNSEIKKYLYYDQEKLTYLFAPLSSCEYASTSQANEVTAKPNVKKSKIEKHDKVKKSKKIAKDMERWAKTLNQKREPSAAAASSSSNEDSLNNIIPAGSADIGYLVLETQNSNSLMNCTSDNTIFGMLSQKIMNSAPLKVVHRENDALDEKTRTNEMEFVDFTKLICKLCKRQLPSAELLSKHAAFSNLHKINLETLKAHSKKNDAVSEKTMHHNEAKDRRKRHKDSDETGSNEIKKKHLQSAKLIDNPVATAVTKPIICKNENAYTAFTGESYKDNAKKVLYARYRELN